MTARLLPLRVAAWVLVAASCVALIVVGVLGMIAKG